MNEKHHSGKTSPVGIFIASLCICLYLSALVFAVVRIYIHIDQRRDVAQEEFTDIAYLVRSSAQEFSFMDEQFTEKIQKALSASKTLEGLIITGPYKEYPFEKNPGQAINMIGDSPRFKNRFDFSKQPLDTQLSIQNVRNVNIAARAAAADYGQISEILKQTLLIVLAALLLSFITLLMLSLLEKSGVKHRPRASADSGLYQTHNKIPVEDDYFDARDYDKLPVSAPEPAVESPPPRQNAIKQEHIKKEVHNHNQADKPQTANGSKVYERKSQELPKGLYSPHGNIGWEDYTAARLESELLRCAANEQDLVYVAMEFKDLDVVDENFYLSFAGDAVIFFKMRDLIFEKGERGIAVIQPNISLEAAISKAGEFHDRCLNKYGKVFKSKTDLCIGISSRSGRLIDAQRLMFEADEALKKALSDPVSHIIAFKSDPEKYRAYIASQNSY